MPPGIGIHCGHELPWRPFLGTPTEVGTPGNADLSPAQARNRMVSERPLPCSSIGVLRTARMAQTGPASPDPLFSGSLRRVE